MMRRTRISCRIDKPCYFQSSKNYSNANKLLTTKTDNEMLNAVQYKIKKLNYKIYFAIRFQVCFNFLLPNKNMLETSNCMKQILILDFYLHFLILIEMTLKKLSPTNDIFYKRQSKFNLPQKTQFRNLEILLAKSF